MKDLFKINNNLPFSKELPFDSIAENYSRQVDKACFSYVETKQPSKPELVYLSASFLEQLEVEIDDTDELISVLNGKERFNEASPYAMCYGGHQF